MPGIPFPHPSPMQTLPPAARKHPPLESSPCLEAPIATVAWGEARGPASHLLASVQGYCPPVLGHHSS